MSLLANKTEALLALGNAATVGCHGCIGHHLDDALAMGATVEEVRRTIALARRLGGESSSVSCDHAETALSNEMVPV